MVWVKIKNIEDSKLNDSKIVYFDYFEKENYTIVSKKVLNYLDIFDINDINELFVVKTFNQNNKSIFIVKKAR